MERTGLVFLLILHQTFAVLEVIVPPSKTSLTGSRVVLPCTFRVDYPPVNTQFLAIFWHFGNKELLRYDNKGTVASPEVSIDEKAAMNGDVSLTIHNVTLSDEGTYKCLVIYSPDRLQKEINLNIQVRPVVKVTRKFVFNDDNTVLQCSVSGYYPAQIKVTWLKDGQPLTKHTLSSPQRNADKTFRVNSTVSLTPSEVKNNPLMVCQAEHKSLQNPIQDGINVVHGDVPSVRIFSSKSHQDLDQIFVCEVSGLDPGLVKVNWLQNGRSIEMRKSNADGSIKTDFYYSLRPTSNSQLESVSCEVEHESLDSPIVETIQMKTKDNSPNVPAAVILTMVITAALILAIFWFLLFKTKYFQRFRVSNILRPELWKDDDKVALSCSASDCVKDVQVTWTVTESDGNKVTIPDSQSSKDEESGQLLISDYTMRADRSVSEGLHNVISTLSFIPSASKHKNMKIVCKFDCDGKSKEKRLNWVDHCKKPEISDPIKLTLCDTGEVLCCVTLQRFYPKSIRIRWTCGDGSYKDLETDSETFTYNNDQTCNVQSVCRIPGHMFNEPGFKVRVTWSHGSMDNPEHRELSIRDTDFVWRPVIDEVTTLPHIVNRMETKLQCNISGYFPDSLDVKWLKREAGNQALFPVSPSEKYKIPVMDVRREADNTFTCTASLFVFVSAQSEGGAEFICQVGHPSLERPLMKSTGPLTVKGAPVVTSITYYERSIILDIDKFYPQYIVIKWSRAESKPKDYKEISDCLIQNKLHCNSDASYRLTSICEAMSLLDRMNPNDVYIKAIVQHDALTRPVELNFLRSKGTFYNTSGGERKELPKMASKGQHNIPESNFPVPPECEQTPKETVSAEQKIPEDQTNLNNSADSPNHQTPDCNQQTEPEQEPEIHQDPQGEEERFTEKEKETKKKKHSKFSKSSKKS
ncbi:uncharacterized protein O3C94_018410 [Discoglossus pictus]